MIETSTVESCLRGCEFPASRDQIVKSAERNSCPSDVVTTLREMNVEKYRSMDDVRCHLGDISACT
jgi:hypothetical protein